MTYTRIIAATIALGSVSVVGLEAQQLNQNPVPAEFPPASFSGSQYVDSEGCVFIRAGVDGTVTWVPRVTRDRRQVCGAQPSLSGAQTRTAAPVAPEVEQIVPRETPPAVATAPVATPAPVPAPRTVRQTAPAPQATTPRQAQPVTTTTRRTPSPPPAPLIIQNNPPRQATPAATPAPAQQTGGCPNASAFSQQYINSGSRYPVRCGPQEEPPFTRPGGSAASGSGGGERILPAHLLESRLQLRDVIVPEGYEPVWEDDRLNPRRGEQTVEGYKQSQSVLTLTVPRRQPSARARQRVREPRLASDEPVRTPSPQFIVGGSAGGVAKAPIAPQRIAPSQIFVQVAQITDPARAQATAQKMARTGVPTRMGTKIRGGSSVRLVLAGPFNTRAEAQRAVQTARRAGFSGAVIMN